MGKCRSDRGTVLPSASFVPPGSTKAKSESGRLLMDWVVSCATTGFLSRPAAFSVPVDPYGFHRRRERLQCCLLAGPPPPPRPRPAPRPHPFPPPSPLPPPPHLP